MAGKTSDARSKLVSVVIPTRDRPEKLIRCIESVRASSYPDLEVIVVDDSSKIPAETDLPTMSGRVRFLRNQDRLFLACSRNRGAAASRGRYVFFLDDDNVLCPKAIESLVRSIALSDEVAVACPVIYHLSQPSRVWTSTIQRGRFPGFYRLQTDTPTGLVRTFSFHNSFMIRRSVFEELDGFDCVNFPVRFGEIDLAHRLRSKGYVAVVDPGARSWHDLGWALAHVDSSRAFYTERNRMIIIKRYYSHRDFVFYCTSILPFVGAYYLMHHALSSSDGRVKTISSLIKGIASGLTYKEKLRHV